MTEICAGDRVAVLPVADWSIDEVKLAGREGVVIGPVFGGYDVLLDGDDAPLRVLFDEVERVEL